MKNSIAIFVLSVLFCEAVNLPSYITKCKFKDPTMQKCISDNIPIIRPYLKEGIKEMGIPPLNPFHVKKVEINANDLKITMTDLKLLNLDEFTIVYMDLNGTSYEGIIDFHFDKIQILGTYDIDGKVLILPIQGHGAANITLYDFVVNFVYKFAPVERNGVMYIKLSDKTFIFKTGKISLHFENLFNGNKMLGDQMNAFLNENWRDVEDLLKAPLTNTVSAMISQILDQVADRIPLSDMFIV